MSHVEFELSDIGEGLEEAEIIRWLVEPGQSVQRDQPIVEVMTDKSNAELPAPVAGTIVSVQGSVGDIVRVGAVLAVIDPSEVAVPVSTASSPQPAATPSVATFQRAAQAQPPVKAERAEATHDAALPGNRPKASPATRRAAAQQGIDLSTIIGSGPGGRILLTDLDAPSIGTNAASAAQQAFPVADAVAPEVALAPEQAIAQPEPPVPHPTPPRRQAVPRPVADGTVALRGIRRAIAQNMHRSWSQIPHIHSFEHIDAEPLLALRAQLRNSGRAEFASITPLSLMVAAVRDAMAQFPQANASLDLEAETITNHAAINIGIAVAAPQGLVVPVVRDAAKLTLTAMVAEVRRLVDGARAGTLDRSEFVGGTVTITNFGSLGGEQALPLIRPPESVIFGFGSIAARPFVIGDQVVPRKTMNLVLGADHRLLDGDVVTGLLTHIARSLTAPINLALGS